jgi:hypothetical protein
VGDDDRIDPTICASRFTIKTKGVKCRFGTLESILSPRTLVGMGGGVRSGGQFSHS